MADADINLCLNCENKIDDDYKFCPYCGQETQNKVVPIKNFVSEFLGDYFTFDSKIFRSVIPLLIKPGLLTKEYLEGKRVKYIPPLRLYIFISIIFFLLLSLESASERIASPQQNEVSQGISDDFFDEFFNNYIPKLFFIFLPLFALILRGLFFKFSAYYYGHFIFSLHFHAFVFLLFSFYLLLSKFNFNELFFTVMLVICLVYTAVYLFMALFKVYQNRIGITLFKFFVLISTYIVILIFLSIMGSYFLYQWRNNTGL